MQKTRIYLDNAATTPIDAEVLEAMLPYFTDKFGNPSSIYSYGREAKMAIEQARKEVAKAINAQPGEIIFTSGGTESTNMALKAAVLDLGCSHIITSPIEHHATLHTAEQLAKQHQLTLSLVKLNGIGQIDFDDLERLLQSSAGKAIITLMHANNEIGNLLDIERVGILAKQYNALFHSDTVQTLGHYALDVQKVPVHFINGSAHKIHGPKGVGMLYVRNDMRIKPFITGGSQERNMRAGTENIYGIVGFAKALSLATTRMPEDAIYIQNLKSYMAERLVNELPNVCINGAGNENCLYTVLNVAFPKTDKTDMLLINLDMAGICVSGGSACSSGANNVSHVIEALHGAESSALVPIRFSFSRYNKKEEIDKVMDILKGLL